MKRLHFLLLPALLLVLSNYCNADFFLEGEPDLDFEQKVEAKLPNFSSMVKALSPSVVNISVEAETPDKATAGEELPFPFNKEGPPVASLGSGFVISPDGYLVTNNHVIKEAKKVLVRLLDDKTEYEAKVIGRDPMTDLALLKIEPHDKLKPLYLGDSDKVEVGEWVIAIGNQFQLGQTVTVGIVSAKSRRIIGSQSRPYDQFIQTDASINPGSSGGPLINTKGQVIAINTAIFTPGRYPQSGTGFNIGIGFSIPINIAKSIIKQLHDHGRVVRGLLGVLIQEVTPDLAAVMNLKDASGALVSEVKSGSPAAKAGFKVRDVIIKFNGQQVKSHDDLPLMVANTSIGSLVDVEILRDGKILTLKPQVVELKDPDPSPSPKADANKWGLVLRNITDEDIKAYDLGSERGPKVESIKSGSLADKAGMLAGDVIVQVNGKSNFTADSLNSLIKDYKFETPALLYVKRRDGALFVTLKK